MVWEKYEDESKKLKIQVNISRFNRKISYDSNNNVKPTLITIETAVNGRDFLNLLNFLLNEYRNFVRFATQKKVARAGSSTKG